MAKHVPTEHGSEAHTGTMGTHSQLSGVGTSDHHVKTGDNEVKGLILSGLDANIGAAGTDGKLYYATDTFKLYRDNGVSWDLIAVINLADLSEKAHGSLTGVTSDQHHAQVHTHVEADITNLVHNDTDAIHDNVAAEISAITEKVTPVSADLILIEDSAAANAKKKVQVGNLPAPSPTSGTVILINADEVQASGAASSTEANMKTYNLPANSYSKIIVEADGYFVCGSTQSNRFQFRIKIGASISSYQIITQGASLYASFSIKFSAVQTAAATISVCCTATVGDGTYYCNSLRIYGVV